MTMDQEDRHPGKIFEMSGAYWKSCALHAAVKLDVFTTLGEDLLTAGLKDSGRRF